jgi:hypothetical protein
VVLTGTLLVEMGETFLNPQFGRVVPLDLLSFLISGQASRDGMDPYAVYPANVLLHDRGLDFAVVNLNPPALLPLFRALSGFDWLTVSLAWRVASVLLYAVAVCVLVRRYRRGRLTSLWAASFPPFWIAVWHGQLYAILAVLSALAWLSAERRTALTGGAIGLIVAIKPNFATWPALLFVGGHRRVSASALAIAGVVTLASFAVEGPAVMSGWMRGSTASGSLLVAWRENGSLPAVGARLGEPLAGYVGAVAILAWVAWRYWRRRPDFFTTSSAALAGALLAGPIAWPGYGVVLLPNFLDRRWDGRRVLAAIAFSLVPLSSLLPPTDGVWSPVASVLSSLGAVGALLLLTSSSHRV